MTHTEAKDAYEASDTFNADAVEWLCDNPPRYVVEAARYEFRRSERYATIIDDAVSGAGCVWEHKRTRGDEVTA